MVSPATHPKKVEQIENKFRSFLAATSLATNRREHSNLGRSYGRNNAFLTWSHQPYQEAIEAIGQLGLKVSSKAIGKTLTASMIKLFEDQAGRENADPEVEAHLDSILPILDSAAIDQEVRSLLAHLSSLVRTYTLFVPVEGVELKRLAKLALGEAILYQRDHGPIPDLLQSSRIRPSVQDIIQKGIGRIECYAMVEAEGELGFTEQVALRKVEDVTHILNLLLASSYSRFQGYRKIWPIRQIGSSPGCYQLILHADLPAKQLDVDAAKWGLSESSPYGHDYEICREDLEKWDKLGLEKVVGCFATDSPQGQIASKIRQATLWYSKAMSADSPEERFVAAAIALESLLVGKGEGGSSPGTTWGSIGQPLADRAAFLIGERRDRRIAMASTASPERARRLWDEHRGRGPFRGQASSL